MTQHIKAIIKTSHHNKIVINKVLHLLYLKLFLNKTLVFKKLCVGLECSWTSGLEWRWSTVTNQRSQPLWLVLILFSQSSEDPDAVRHVALRLRVKRLKVKRRSSPGATLALMAAHRLTVAVAFLHDHADVGLHQLGDVHDLQGRRGAAMKLQLSQNVMWYIYDARQKLTMWVSKSSSRPSTVIL